MKKRMIVILMVISIIGLTACSKDKETPVVTPSAIPTETEKVVNTPTEEVKPTDEVTPTGEVEPTNALIEETIDPFKEDLKRLESYADTDENGKPIYTIEDIKDFFEYDDNNFIIKTVLTESFLYDNDGNLQYYLREKYNEDNTITYTVIEDSISFVKNDITFYIDNCKDFTFNYQMTGDEIEIYKEKSKQEDYEEAGYVFLSNIPIENDFENGSPFWTKKECKDKLRENGIPEEYIEKALNEHYPLTEKEQADRLVEWAKYKGNGVEVVKKLFEMYEISLEYFDEDEYNQNNDELIKASINDLQNNLYTITKQNLYDILLKQGYSDKEIKSALEKYYVVRSDKELIEYLKDSGSEQASIDAFLERYHNELTLK